MPMRYDAPPDSLDRDLVFNFFWKFSVFECALKREGFLQTTGQNNAAIPDWDRFGKSVAQSFGKIRAEGFQEAVRELKRASPRRQVVRDERLAWEEIVQRSDESEEQFVLRLMKTTRNNLFHGGKYPDPDGRVAEISRDKGILRAALKVLEGCYELHPGVARRIKEAA